MKKQLLETLKVIAYNASKYVDGDAECCFCGCRAGHKDDIPHENWCPMKLVIEAINEANKTKSLT